MVPETKEFEIFGYHKDCKVFYKNEGEVMSTIKHRATRDEKETEHITNILPKIVLSLSNFVLPSSFV